MSEQLYRIDNEDFAGRCNHNLTTEDYERAIETCRECPAVMRWMVPDTQLPATAVARLYECDGSPASWTLCLMRYQTGDTE